MLARTQHVPKGDTDGDEEEKPCGPKAKLY